MSSFQIKLQRQADKAVGIRRWCLDFPVHDQSHTAIELTEQGLVFQGWVLRQQLAELQIELQHGEKTEYFPLNVARPDVVKIILKEEPAEHPQLYCGFYFTARLERPEFRLGLRWRGEFVPWIDGQLNGEFKVLAGFEQWLYLDNDTNQSVEQHLGKLLLSEQCQLQWQQYFSESQQLATAWHKPFALLLAPSKEAVYPQFHPQPRAAFTVIEQLLTLCPHHYPLVYPEPQLKAARQAVFPKTDTHWTTYGACLATIELAVQLGFDRDEVTGLFAADKYKTVVHCGDLGNKLFPQQRSEELFQCSFNCYPLISYDSKLPNFGRIMVIENPAALHPGHCLQFGSSSSYTMLNFIARLFGRVTLVHTAGNIDPSLVDLLSPDFVVSQTNARFVVRAPVTDYNLREIMQQKLSGLDVAKVQGLFQQAEAMAAKSASAQVEVVHRLFAEIYQELAQEWQSAAD